MAYLWHTQFKNRSKSFIGIPEKTIKKSAIKKHNLQSCVFVGRTMGIEPTSAGATIRCVNHFATTAIMAGIVGVEPTLTVLETVVLPLNYIPIIDNK